ncbi:MAG: putative rane protein HdeD, family [Bradyrhizobium sp.]|nr:putative rane protein HdeD, family [Bradyrhizobium sp.]
MASTTFNPAPDVKSNSAARTLVQNWWPFTVRGVLGIIFGSIALIFPGPTILSLVILFSAYMLVDGVFAILSAVRAIRRKQDRGGLLIMEGLLNIFVGIAAFLWPGLTVVVFVWLVAAWAIVTGGLMTAAGFQLNIDHGRWWLVLGGLLSLAYGALLIVTPLIGAIVLTWWLGAYAFVFGVALLVFSFKLRSRQHKLSNPTAAGTAASSR